MSDSTNDINWVYPAVNYIPDHDGWDRICPICKIVQREAGEEWCSGIHKPHYDELTARKRDEEMSENE